MPEGLITQNEGPLLRATNFWRTPHARQGYFYLTTNAGCFRLLVPNSRRGMLRDMRTAQTCVLSRGPFPQLGPGEFLEVLFDDGSKAPFSLHLSAGQLDRWPQDQDTTGAWTLAVYTHLVDDRPKLEFERPAFYRRSRRLPDLRPWQG